MGLKQADKDSPAGFADMTRNALPPSSNAADEGCLAVCTPLGLHDALLVLLGLSDAAALVPLLDFAGLWVDVTAFPLPCLVC